MKGMSASAFHRRVTPMPSSLGIMTTAEGIENLTNSTWLAQKGCTFGQGYLFGPPVPAAGAGRIIEEAEALRAAANLPVDEARAA